MGLIENISKSISASVELVPVTFNAATNVVASGANSAVAATDVAGRVLVEALSSTEDLAKYARLQSSTMLKEEELKTKLRLSAIEEVFEDSKFQKDYKENLKRELLEDMLDLE